MPTRAISALAVAAGGVALALSFGAGAAAAATDGAPATNKPVAAATKDAGKKKPPARTRRRPAKKGAAAPGLHAIPEGAPKITPFPTETRAVDKAFAEHRREQLAGVEQVARAAKQDDRWRTVLFELRDFDAYSDPEACFWRVLAYYRLGEVARARGLRQGCELAPRDRATLDGEDGAAASLQPAVPVQEAEARGGAEPVANASPYTGPQPARWK
jgi:hypothetical protein